jgi:OmpA-OmpF porin, OOP family
MTFDRMTNMLAFLLALFVLPVVMAAEVSNSAADRLGASTSSRRDDPAASLQLRLKEQVAKGASIDTYAVALAQAWLDYARESYYRKDRSAAKEALDEAKAVIEALERRGVDAVVDARIMPSSLRLREDLWRKAAAHKQHIEFRCATWQTARMEIALVAAGRANNDMGWRAARPFVQRAERFGKEADQRLAACAEPKAAATKPDTATQDKAIESGAITAPPQAAKTLEAAPVRSLPDRIHFARESAELSDVSALVLEQVSYVMRGNPVIVLDLRGHADEAATATDNEKLALARAQAVRDYLVETGIGGERLMVKTGSIAAAEGAPALERAKRRRVELVPTQSEHIPVEYQDQDLVTDGPSGS